MIKKAVLFITVLCLLFSFTVSAAEENFSVKVSDEFYTSAKDKEKVCEILGYSKDEFDSYCSENNIEFFAVNSDNTKQVKLSISLTDFSNAVINISNFTDDKITALLPDMTGIENVKGDIIDKNGQKFALIQLRSSDSGGDFILKEYITVADKKSYTLSFYMEAGADDSFVLEIFETFTAKDFVSSQSGSSAILALKYIIPIAAGLFAAVCIVIAVTIIRDIRKSKTDE